MCGLMAVRHIFTAMTVLYNSIKRIACFDIIGVAVRYI